MTGINFPSNPNVGQQYSEFELFGLGMDLHGEKLVGLLFKVHKVILDKVDRRVSGKRSQGSQVLLVLKDLLVVQVLKDLLVAQVLKDLLVAGAQGSAGSTGAQGSAGSQGCGSTGAQGSAGSTGAQGSAGSTGAQGATGSSYSSSDDITTRNLKVTGITTYTGATVKFTGDSYNAVWNQSDDELEFEDNARLGFGDNGSGVPSDLTIKHNTTVTPHASQIENRTDSQLEVMFDMLELRSSTSDRCI